MSGERLHARDGAEESLREDVRGELFTGLDRLAFALEVEAAEAIRTGDEAAARRLEDQRLGVRLAQRLVTGVHADEVDLRLQRTAAAYDARTSVPAGDAGAAGIPAADR